MVMVMVIEKWIFIEGLQWHVWKDVHKSPSTIGVYTIL